MMDNNFLLTFSYTNKNEETTFGYEWLETEDELIDSVRHKEQVIKDFKVNDAIEMLGNIRDIDV